MFDAIRRWVERKQLQELAHGFDEPLEVPELIFQDGVHAAPIDLQILVNENVAETGHRHELLR